MKYIILKCLLLLILVDFLIGQEDLIEVPLTLNDVVALDQNGGIIRYNVFPGVLNIDRDYIYLGYLFTNYIKIYKINKNGIIDSCKMFGGTNFSFDVILTGIKYFRVYKRDKLYFIDKNSFVNDIVLEGYPSIKINQYLENTKILSNNFSTYSYGKLYDYKLYDSLLIKFNQEKIPNNIYHGEVDLISLYSDSGLNWLVMFSKFNLLIYNYKNFYDKSDKAIYFRVKRNTIFAYYGRIFKDEWLQNYFNSQFWYKPNPNYSDDMLNEFDKEEVQILLKMEKELKEKK